MSEKLIEGLREQHRRDSAELRRLCAERDQLRAEVQALRVDVEAWKASHSLLTDTCHHFQARAKLLSAECVELAVRWERMGDEHGVRQFTGNDHKLFANELRAVLHKWSQRE